MSKNWIARSAGIWKLFTGRCASWRSRRQGSRGLIAKIEHVTYRCIVGAPPDYVREVREACAVWIIGEISRQKAANDRRNYGTGTATESEPYPSLWVN